jgi:hypothetical protein
MQVEHHNFAISRKYPDHSDLAIQAQIFAPLVPASFRTPAERCKSLYLAELCRLLRQFSAIFKKTRHTVPQGLIPIGIIRFSKTKTPLQSYQIVACASIRIIDATP